MDAPMFLHAANQPGQHDRLEADSPNKAAAFFHSRSFPMTRTALALPLFLCLLLAGCKSSPLDHYEAASVSYVAISDTMVALKARGVIDRDTLAAFDRAATPVGASIKAWGTAILEEYAKPQEERDFARLESTMAIALEGVKQLLKDWKPR